MEDINAIRPGAAAELHPKARTIVPGIVIGGTVAGVIDIFAAALINSAPPPIILQAIASGLLGHASFSGGAQTMVLGFVLQVAMSLLIAAIFGVAATRLPALTRRPVTFGVLYGVGVFFVMNFIVVPLSAVHPKHIPSLQHMAFDMIAMILFGLIISMTQAFTFRRSSPRP